MANEVTESTIYSNTFKTIYTLINANKVSGTTVYAGFPNNAPSFPLYAIQPAQTLAESVSYGDENDYDISIEIELWCVASDLKSKIDELKQNVFSTILSNTTSLRNSNLLLASDWFDDTNVASVEFNNEKFHTGAVLIKFKLI